MFDKKVVQILEKAYAKVALTKEDCIYLLKLDRNSTEANIVRAAANDLIRKRTNNSAAIFGQIGVEAFPCEADCSFCSFGKSHTSFSPIRVERDTIAQKIHDFCKGGDLYGLYMMTMHTYDLDFFLDVVKIAKENVIGGTKLFSNVGDTSYEAFVEMKAAGIDGVYHVCRLGEGEYTKLSPKDRFKTMENAKAAGLDLLDCVEPIGTEHTAEELVDRIFLSLEMECIQTGCMKRVAVPGTPLAKYGQISDFELGYILAVQSLAIMQAKAFPVIGVHEPNEIGYVSGGNMICAETGINPRDTEADTAANRGLDVDACRRILFESGFERLYKGDGTTVELNEKYIKECFEK